MCENSAKSSGFPAYDPLESLFILPMSRASHSRRAKLPRPRRARLLLVCAVSVAILLLFLRLLNFVHGHGARYSR